MDYSFANGVISVLETKVLDRNKLFVLTKYEKKDFVKVLLSMNYGNSNKSLEALIQSENTKVKETIDKITPSKKDTDLFYLLNDAQNIKVLYKIKKFSIDKSELLNDFGTITLEDLTKAILEDDFTKTSKDLKKLVLKINQKTKEISDAKLLSAIIDNELYQYALEMTKDQILTKYIKTKIDFTNVISMLRSKNLGWNKEQYLQMFIEGGVIDKHVLVDSYDKSQEEQIKTLAKYYNESISKFLMKKQSMSKFQLELDRQIIEIMKDTKSDPFSIGPIIYYYLLKQAEAQNIRMLYSLNKVELKDLI